VFRGIMDTVGMRGIASGSLDSVSFSDNIRQWADTPASLVLPAGHNHTAREVVRRLFSAAGYPWGDNFGADQLSREMLKPVDLANGDWLSLAQAICDVYGARVVDQGNGILDFVFIDPENAPKQVQWLYDERDIVVSVNGASAEVGLEAATETYTRVSVRGSKQTTRDAAGGVEVQIFEQKSYSQFRDGKPYQQSQNASSPFNGIIVNDGQDDFLITGNPLGSDPTLISTTITTISTETPPKGENVPTKDTEITVTRALYNNRMRRFRRDSDDDSVYSYGFARAEGENLDGGTGYAFPYAREQVTDYSITERSYNSVGELVSVVTKVYGMYSPKAAKENVATGDSPFSPTVSPEQVSNAFFYLAPGALPGTDRFPFIPLQPAPIGYLYTDDGEGNIMSTGQDACLLLEQQIESYESDNGYLTRKTTRDFAWAKIPGANFSYPDGSLSESATEQFREVGQTIETFAQINESEVLKITKRINNFAATGNSVVTERFNGSLQAVPAKSGYILREDYESEADFLLALAADRFEQQEITAECNDFGLESARSRNDLSNAFVEWAETREDLEQYCARLLASGRAFIFTFAVPVNALMREGDYMRVIYGPLKVNHDAFVLNLSHTGGAGAPMLTQVRALCLTTV
jgi:hypothetical protein